MMESDVLLSGIRIFINKTQIGRREGYGVLDLDKYLFKS